MANYNVLVRVPKVGDILCVDASGNKHYIALDTYQSSSHPAGYTVVGVVALRQGNQAIIVHKTNTTKKWSDIDRWKMEGAALTDGESHSGTLKIGSDEFSFTWQTSSLSAFASALNTFVAANHPSGHTYTAEYSSADDCVYLLHHTYTTRLAVTLTGVTVNEWIGRELEANTNIYGINGVGSEYKGINWKRYLEVIKTSTSSTFNPTTPLTSLGVYPISYNCYASEIGAYARNIYGEGEANYEKYLHDYMVNFPSHRGALEEEFRNGKANTYALVGKTYNATDNTEKPLYPAAEYAAAVEYDSDGLRSGDWYLPSIYEIIKIWSQLTYGTSGVARAEGDAINRSLNAIGGSAISAASGAWSSCRCFTNGAWLYSSYGSTSYYSFCGASCAVPCVLLNLSESED